MLSFVLKDGHPRRIACTNEATYTFLWPCFFTSAVPGVRPLCRYVARRGAAVHGGVRLVMRRGGNNSSSGGRVGHCCLVASRDLQAGTPLISLPLSLSLSVTAAGDANGGGPAGEWDPLETLTGLVVRHLHNPHSPHRRYLELLHDLHNMDADDDDWEPVVGGGGLRAQVNELYGGNAMHAKGVDNAPFLEKETLRSLSQRVEWVRTQALVRRVEQSVPHFAAKFTRWGLSMVLARSFVDDNGGLSMYPLIDFCAHSYQPNTALRVCATPSENRRCGVRWHDAETPCVHLIAQKPLRKGDEVTRLFSPRPATSREDSEYWQMRWGFVPERPS